MHIVDSVSYGALLDELLADQDEHEVPTIARGFLDDSSRFSR
ncbi:hypothetical protein ACGFWE_13865 [Streptomyces sp. NPDC048523]